MSACPNLSNPQVKKEFNHMINAIGETLSYGLYEKNNNNTLQYAPNGNPSKLYESLLSLHNGDVNKAIYDKARIYSKDFTNWFGDWINNTKESEASTTESTSIEKNLKLEDVLAKEDLDRLDNIDKEIESLEDDTKDIKEKVSIFQSILDFLDRIVETITNIIKKDVGKIMDAEGVFNKIYTTLEVLEKSKLKHYLPKRTRIKVTGTAKILRGAIDTAIYYTLPTENYVEEVSKVVDENGEPLIVYHGSNPIYGGDKIQIFDKTKSQPIGIQDVENKEYEDHGGFHFGTLKAANDKVINDQRRDDAMYGEELNPNFEPSIYPSYLSIKKLDRSDDLGGTTEWTTLYNKDNIGYIYKNKSKFEDRGKDSYVVFNPNQIKLAITPTQRQKEEFDLDEGKVGKFDGSNGNIYYQSNENRNLDTKMLSKLTNRMQEVYSAIQLSSENLSSNVKGKAIIDAMRVITNPNLQSTDTLPHEYAHHYIAWFRNTPIVQEAIKKWGSEEKLVQAIGEQVVEQKGEANTFWKKFTNWIFKQFNKLSKLKKEELRNILTDTFLEGIDLVDGSNITTESSKRLALNATHTVEYQTVVETNDEDFLEDLSGDADDTVYGTVDKIRNAAITNYENRIRSLRVAIARHPDKAAKYSERIDEMKANIEDIKQEIEVNTVIDTVSSTLGSISVDLNENANATDLLMAQEQLSTLDKIATTSLKYIENPKLVQQLETLRGSITMSKNKAMEYIYANILKTANKQGYSMTMGDLKEAKDTDWGTAWLRDSSTINDKLVSMLDFNMKLADRGVISNYNIKIEEFNKYLDALKTDKIDINSEEVLNRMLQKDKDGKLTKNFVNKYSDEYWSHIKELTGDMRRLHKYSRKAGANAYAVRKKMLSIGKDLMNNMSILDPIYFNENIAKEEKTALYNKLVSEIGVVEAEALVKHGEAQYERYLTSMSNMESYYIENNESYEVAMEKLEKWKKYNDPSVFLKQFTDKKGTMTNIAGLSYIAMSPKNRTTDGKTTKWFDKDYAKLQKGPKSLSNYFNFVTKTIQEYSKYYPSYINKGNPTNYLPEVFTDLFKDAINNKFGAGTFYNMALSAISEADSKVYNTTIRGADGRQKGNIPAPHTANNVGRYKKAIEVTESKIRMLQFAIETNESVIEDTGGYEEVWKKVKADKKALAELKEDLIANKLKYETAYEHKSTNITEIFKKYTLGAINYKRKASVEDLVLLGKTVMEEREEIETTKFGKKVTANGEYVTFSNGLVRMNKSVDNTIKALLYSDYRAKEGTLGFRVGTNKISREVLKKYSSDKSKLRAKFKSGEITKEEFKKQLLNLEEKSLKDVEGIKEVTTNKLLDTLHNYTYLKSLGWNPFSALANKLNGDLVNSIEAASGEFFNRNDLLKAKKLMRYSFYKGLTGVDNKIADKNRALINKYGILFRMLETEYGAEKALDMYKKKAGLLNPMEGQKRTEYLNQGTVLLANLLSTKIKDKNGNEVSLYDAYDDNGDMLPEFDAEVWNSSVVDTEVNEFTDMRDRVLELNKKLHGNYDPSSPVLYKRYAVGRALGVFRSWIPEAFAARFEAQRYNRALKTDVKGRYRSYKALAQQEGALGALKTTIEMLLKMTFRMKYSNGKLDKIDFYNMKRNVKEIQWLLATTMAYFLAMAALGGDDEDKKKYRMTANMISRLQGDITLYFNPLEMNKMISNPLPALSSLMNIGSIIPSAIETMYKDDKTHTAQNFLYQKGKYVPGINVPLKAYDMTEQVY